MEALALLKLAFLAFAFDVAEGKDNCMIQEDYSPAQASAVQFIQTRLAVDGEDRREARPYVHPSIHPSIVSALPVHFLHIPKAGGIQFGVSILLLDHVCWNLTRHDISDLQSSLDSLAMAENHWSQDFEDMCSLSDMRRYGYYFLDHSGIGSTYGQYVKAHGLTMLRQPEQRILSGWSFIKPYHSWPYYIFQRDPVDELEYAKVVAGCSVKMLTRDGASEGTGDNHTVCGDPAHATDSEVKQAIERLAQGFLYVGILEEWAKSMTLFHAMFGGNCQAREFLSSNSNGNSSVYDYDTSVLQGWTDEQDGKLYKEGLILFQTGLHRYRVTDERVRICLTEANN